MSDLIGTKSLLCRYRYDALDRLAGVNTETVEPVQRFYQKTRLSVEIQGAVCRSVFQFEDQLMAEHRLSGSTGRSDLLGTDGQRSVLHTQGSQGQQSIVYSAYGHSTPADALPGFNGERRDPLTGHYLLGNGYRAYNPVLLRFNQPDNLSPFGRGGLNAYAYCQGDPVNRRDPSGHISGVRVPGLTMFPQAFPLQKLPGEMLEQVFKSLSAQNLISIANTSTEMQRRVMGLSKVPKYDLEDATALLSIQRDLKGGTQGVLPARLKNDAAYKARFERIAAGSDERMAAHIQETKARRKSFIARVAGKSMSHEHFLNAVASTRRNNAGAPDRLAIINGVSDRYDEFWIRQRRLEQQRIELQALAKSIRFNLQSR
ncbi:hypothetical protein PS3A_01370 [Pseudomonas sp. 3A(2025)]